MNLCNEKSLVRREFLRLPAATNRHPTVSDGRQLMADRRLWDAASYVLWPHIRVSGASVMRRIRVFAMLCAVTLHISTVVFAQSDTERIRLQARQRLGERYFTNPSACHDGWFAGSDNYIVALEPWAEVAGLRRGDRLDTIAGQSTAAGWPDAMPRVRPDAGSIPLRVNRAGQTAAITLPCQDHTSYLAAEHQLHQTMADAKWVECLSAADNVTRVFGRAISMPLAAKMSCLYARGMADKRYASSADGRHFYWTVTHQYYTHSIAENAFRPNGIAEIRTGVLEAIGALEKSGWTNYATDLRQQLSVASSAAVEVDTTSSSLSVSTFYGTAFVIDPDGYLLTAYHVVDEASYISVSCPGVGSRHAIVDAKAPLVDLAVLRVDGPHLNDYLSIASRQATLGEKVFTVGYPVPGILGADPKYTDGTISSLSGPGGDASFFQINVSVQPGNSGGALLDERGDVLGVVVAAASPAAFLKQTGTLPQNVNWAVKAAFVAPLLKTSQPVRSTVEKKALSSAEVVIAKVAAASCLVTATGGAKHP
jgi:S1-C subfamily serine protease